MSLQPILCVLIFLIKLFCVSSSRPSCSPVVTAPACIDGYVETPSPRACVKISSKSQKFEDAIKSCAAIERPYSSAWVPYNSKMSNQLKALMKSKSSKTIVWIGLTDVINEGVWLWTNGQSVRKSTDKWRTKKEGGLEPTGGRSENCAGINRYGKWLDYACSREFPIICMRPHQIGPREIETGVIYHAPNRGPNIIYNGRDITYTCSAFMQDDSDAFLVIRDNARSIYPTTLSFDTANNSLEMCTSIASINMTMNYASLNTYKFECYARNLDGLDYRTNCGNRPNEFCRTFDISRIILDPPIKKPIMKKHTRFKQITIECEVNVGLIGKLSWVLYLKNGIIEILQADDPRITDTTREANDTRWIEKSTLHLNYDVVKGIRVGCFDHNITEYSLNTTCDPDDLFCVIKVLPEDTTVPKEVKMDTLVWFYIVIAGLMVVSCVFSIMNNENTGLNQEAEGVVEQELQTEQRQSEDIEVNNIRISQEKPISRESLVERSSLASESIARESEVGRWSRASESIARKSQVDRSSQEKQRVSRVSRVSRASGVVRSSADETDLDR